LKLRWLSQKPYEIAVLRPKIAPPSLQLFGIIAWDAYCPASRLGEFLGQTVLASGLVVQQKVHNQITGKPMNFLSLNHRRAVKFFGLLEGNG
jgi:hypothetical protein